MRAHAIGARRSAAQRGMVLITSLLLLLVVTLLAVAMFRSMGIDAKIAGNVREKQRALHAAVSAEQFAEYWLSSSSNSATPATTCTGSNAAVNVTNNQSAILICANIPYGPSNTTLNASNFNPAAVPWAMGTTPVGFTYAPGGQETSLSMNIGPAPAGQSAANYYVSSPAFYISYLGPSADGQGTVYQIDAVGYGGSADALAVVESTYEVQSGVRPLQDP